MTARARRPRRSGWRWVVIVVVLAVGYYFSTGLFKRVREKRYPPNAFYQVKRGDMLVSIVEEGALRALNETVVRSALEGLNRIIYLVPEGAYVQKGDLLVELDSSGLRDRFNEQELLYQERLFIMQQATGNLGIQKSLAESQIKDAELKVENAQADLEKYRDGDAPLLVKNIEERSSVLAEQVRIASERYERTQELFKKNTATRSEVEADALILKREQLALEQYQEDLRLVKKYDQPNQVRLLQSNVEQAQAELARLRQRTSNEIAQAEADLKTSEAGLEFLKESLKTQERRLQNARIYAPQNGLVVYSSVSPFQFAGEDERRRDEGRFRIRGRGGDDGGGGEFRFGGRRGRGSNFESSSGGSGGSSSFGSSGGSGGSGNSRSSGGASSSSTAETIAGGNQRIASAISGTPSTEASGSGSAGSSGSGGTGGSSGGGRSGGGSGASGGGQNTSSPATAFASYPSMRQSSLFGASSASNSSASGSGTASTSSSSSSSGQESSRGNQYAGGNQSGSGNQFGFRSSQSFRDFGFDFYGTPGMLEEGTMVRQRQELIRLPDISKMLAEIRIPEARVQQVKAGMTAYVSVNNFPHSRFKASVRRVAPMPDAQSSWMNPNAKLFPADILVEEELPILKPGVSATAEIIITNLTNVLTVPIQTVARLGGENVCFVKHGSGVKPVPVTTGWFNDSFVEITWGLKEGDLVLLAPESDEDLEEAPPETTNNVPRDGENIQRPDQPRRGEFPESGPSPGERFEPGRPQDSRRGDSSESFRNGESGQPGTRRPGDPSSMGNPSGRGESFDSSQPGQGPSPENRQFRRRDFESTNGAAPPGERRRRGGGRPRTTEEAPE